MKPPLDPAIGLCSRCRHARVQRNRRGSAFWRCGRAEADPRLPRYPPLPVSDCGGHEAGVPSSDSKGSPRS